MVIEVMKVMSVRLIAGLATIALGVLLLFSIGRGDVEVGLMGISAGIGILASK